jgi:hypothetical protein
MSNSECERHRDRGINCIPTTFHDLNANSRRDLVRRSYHAVSRSNRLTRRGVRYVDKRQHPNQQ